MKELYELYNTATEQVEHAAIMDAAEAERRNNELRRRGESTRWVRAEQNDDSHEVGE
jgi:hypothetical protein